MPKGTNTTKWWEIFGSDEPEMKSKKSTTTATKKESGDSAGKKSTTTATKKESGDSAGKKSKTTEEKLREQLKAAKEAEKAAKEAQKAAEEAKKKAEADASALRKELKAASEDMAEFDSLIEANEEAIKQAQADLDGLKGVQEENSRLKVQIDFLETQVSDLKTSRSVAGGFDWIGMLPSSEQDAVKATLLEMVERGKLIGENRDTAEAMSKMLNSIFS